MADGGQRGTKALTWCDSIHSLWWWSLGRQRSLASPSPEASWSSHSPWWSHILGLKGGEIRIFPQLLCEFFLSFTDLTIKHKSLRFFFSVSSLLSVSISLEGNLTQTNDKVLKNYSKVHQFGPRQVGQTDVAPAASIDWILTIEEPSGDHPRTHLVFWSWRIWYRDVQRSPE